MPKSIRHLEGRQMKTGLEAPPRPPQKKRSHSHTNTTSQTRDAVTRPPEAAGCAGWQSQSSS